LIPFLKEEPIKEIIKNKNQIPTEIDYDTPSFTRYKTKFPKDWLSLKET